MRQRDPITGEIITANPLAAIPQSYDTIVTTIEAKEPEIPKAVTPVELREAIEEINKDEVQQDDDDWTQVQVDSSMLTAFQACEQFYDYKYNQHLIPITGQSKGVNRGSAVHIGLSSYWKSRLVSDDYQLATKAGIKSAKEFMDKDINFSNDYKLETLQSLLSFLQHIQSNSWIPIEVEKHFVFKAYENAEEKLRIFLTGRIDLILRTPQIPILPVDNKTESERWFYSQMSNQFKIYSIVCGTNIFGVQRIGFQEKVKVEDKFKLEMIGFDQDVLDEFRLVTLPAWIMRMLQAQTNNRFMMNTSNCIHGHFKCQFSDAYNGGICNVSRNVRQQKLDRYFIKGPEWNPAEEVT